MPRFRYIIVIAAVALLTLQGITNGAFLEFLLPGWNGMLGQGLCIAGGYMVQPVWDFGWAKIPIPVTDDWVVGTLFASAISWLYIKRTGWSFRRKILAFVLALLTGMVIYKIIGLFVLYIAEVQYGLTGCIGEFTVGPLTIQWDWYEPLHIFAVILGIGAAIAAIMAFKKRGDGGG